MPQDLEQMSNALPCIICHKPLEKVYRGDQDVGNHPDDGVACTTHGNYGSTVFDSLNGSYLEFNICDPCLLDAAKFNRIAIGRMYASGKQREPLRMWNGNE